MTQEPVFEESSGNVFADLREKQDFRTYAKIAKKLNFSNRQDAKSAENS